MAGWMKRSPPAAPAYRCWRLLSANRRKAEGSAPRRPGTALERCARAPSIRHQTDLQGQAAPPRVPLETALDRPLRERAGARDLRGTRQRFRWACAPFCEPWQACPRRADRCRPVSRRADPAAPQRRAAFPDLRGNQEARASFHGQPAAASPRLETKPCLVQAELPVLLGRPSPVVWPLEPP